MRHRYCSLGLLISLCASCASRPSAPPVAFAESAAYRKLKSNIVAFHETDVDGNGFPDGFIFSRRGGAFTPILYRQEPKGETTQWVRVCKGEPLAGERFEKLRFVRDGAARALLATATIEDPDRLVVEYAVFDPSGPCEAVLRGREELEKPRGAVLSPGPIRLGLQVASDGSLLIVDAPSMTRLRGVRGEIELVTALTVRRWLGSAAPPDAQWARTRRALLGAVPVEASWISEESRSPDAIVGEGVIESAAGEGASSSEPARGSHAGWTLAPGEVGALNLTGPRPFVLLQVRHGCKLGESSALELSSVAGPSLFVTGGTPVANSVFIGSASGRQKPGEASVELGALAEPTRSLGLKLGPVEELRCVRAIDAYGWTIEATESSDRLPTEGS